MRNWLLFGGGLVLLYFFVRTPGCGESHVKTPPPSNATAPVAAPAAAPSPTTEAVPAVAPPAAGRSSIAGRVSYTDGTPAPAITVFAVVQGGQSFRATTNSDGRYVVEGLPGDRIQVSVSPGGRMTRRAYEGPGGTTWRNLDLGASEARAGVDFFLDRGAGTIAGVVNGADGTPSPGTSVYARHVAAGEPCSPFLEPEAVAQTDSTGRFVLEGLSPGKFVVGAESPGTGHASLRDVEIGADVVLTLGRGGVISGFLQTPEGTPPSEVRITFTPAKSIDPTTRAGLSFCFRHAGGMGHFGPDSFISFTQRTRNGAFDLWGLGAGRFDLTFADGEGRRAQMLDVPLAANEQRTGQSLTLATEPNAVAVVGRVVRGGAPVAGVRAFSFQVDGPAFAMTGPDGRFTLLGGRPGTRFTLRFQGGGAGPQSARSVDVPTGSQAINLGDIDIGR